MKFGNSFDDEKTFRDDYDNLYWRDLQDDRELLGNTLNNSFELQVSQSSWPLDPPPDFLTRTTGSMPLAPLSLKGKGGGELQSSENSQTQEVYGEYAISDHFLIVGKHLVQNTRLEVKWSFP